jgi:putative Holliday junction resolvase
MKAFAIDYGSKRLGLAISDATGLVARAMPTLKVKNFADAVSKILEIIKKQGADIVVIGLPLSEKREETQESIQVRYFAQSLEITNGIEIVFWNESFSTQQARASLKNGTKRKKANIDSEAARIILQEYLDYKRDPESQPQVVIPQYENFIAG